ncbi:MAG TPA: GntR family transcriptional regulator [Planctomycetota bacterium]|nr:GntR family transcriptional regulator [Planctomycetota bacterium]
MSQEVAKRLRLIIDEQNLWGKLLAPERELADAFGVSRDTVRKGLDELEREGLISRRQGLGTQVRAREGLTPGQALGQVLVGCGTGSASEFMSGIAEVAGAERWLAAFGNLVMASGRAEFSARLAAGGVDGVILLSITDPRTVQELQAAWSGPLVLVDHYFPELPVTGVMEDCAGGIRRAVEHLLALGHRRIAYVEPSQRGLNPWKYRGYAEALAAAGIPMDESLVGQAAPQFDAGQRAGERLLALADPPTAVVACSDRVAWGVWRAAELAGRKVGADLALVGYGDDSAVSGLGQELSSVAFDPAELGRRAVRTILDLRAGRAKPGGLVLVPTELVIRESSRNVRRPA